MQVAVIQTDEHTRWLHPKEFHWGWEEDTFFVTIPPGVLCGCICGVVLDGMYSGLFRSITIGSYDSLTVRCNDRAKPVRNIPENWVTMYETSP